MFGSNWGKVFAVVGWLIGQGLAYAQQAESPTLESQPIPTTEQQEAKAESSAGGQLQQSEAEKLIPVLNSIKDSLDQLKPSKDDAKEKRNEDRAVADLQAQKDMALWAKRMFWATIVSVVISFVGLGMIWRSLTIAREAIHAERRPWLDFSVGITSDLSENDTDFYPQGIGLDLQLKVRNTGSSPALQVSCVIEEISWRDIDYGRNHSWIKERELLRKKYKSQLRNPLSATVFPQQEIKRNERLLVSETAIGRAIGNLEMPRGRPPSFSLEGLYLIVLYYRSPTSNRVHETSSTFMLLQKAKDGLTNISIHKGEHFKPVMKRSIVIQDFSQKRAD